MNKKKRLSRIHDQNKSLYPICERCGDKQYISHDKGDDIWLCEKLLSQDGRLLITNKARR